MLSHIWEKNRPSSKNHRTCEETIIFLFTIIYPPKLACIRLSSNNIREVNLSLYVIYPSADWRMNSINKSPNLRSAHTIVRRRGIWTKNAPNDPWPILEDAMIWCSVQRQIFQCQNCIKWPPKIVTYSSHLLLLCAPTVLIPLMEALVPMFLYYIQNHLAWKCFESRRHEIKHAVRVMGSNPPYSKCLLGDYNCGREASWHSQPLAGPIRYGCFVLSLRMAGSIGPKSSWYQMHAGWS